jgi:hypothetical protein
MTTGDELSVADQEQAPSRLQRAHLGWTRRRGPGSTSWAVGLLLVSLAVSLSACGSERSVDAFCRVYGEQKSAFIKKYHDRAALARDLNESTSFDRDPLAGFFVSFESLFEAMGDAKMVFVKLDAVAPDEIEPDVAAIRDSISGSIDSSKEAASNPLSAMVGGLVGGLTSAGSWNRVGSYVEANCA